jgi:hypothetical protein
MLVRGRSRRDSHRRRRLECEFLEPRVALANFAEIEPNSLIDSPNAYYQNLFGASTAVVSARLGNGNDVDDFKVNVIQGSLVRFHFDTAPGLSLNYSISSSLTDHRTWQPMPRGGTSFSVGPGAQLTVQPPPDATFIAQYTGSLVIEIQRGPQETYGGVTYGNLVGAYTLQITGLDATGDARIQVNSTSTRRIEAEWTNSTSRKISLEMFYARGTTLDSIIGKSLFAKKLTIPITTKFLGPYEFTGGGLQLPRTKRPARATQVLIVLNRTRAVPETDFSNNIVAIPLSRLR